MNKRNRYCDRKRINEVYNDTQRKRAMGHWGGSVPTGIRVASKNSTYSRPF